MRTPIALLLAVSMLGLARSDAQDGFRPLFTGKDLSGWDGNPELWKIEDGVITGQTTGPEQLAYNQFLIWRGGALKNFELRAKIRVTGNNSGIQYRSQELPANGKWSVGGYQCDVHPSTANNAMVYDERGRGILVLNGQSVIIDAAGGKWLAAEHAPVPADISEWHEYTIIAQGNHLVHQIDGKMTIDLVDHDTKDRDLEGLLAFQLHKGPAMRVQIKDILLKELPDAPLVSLEKNPIPSDAQRIEKPAPPAKKAPQVEAPVKKPTQQAAVGPAIGENKATPVSRIKVPAGFEADLLYSVPGGDQGSWVALCADDKGRIYASDQYGSLYRFKAPGVGEVLRPEDVEKVPVEIRAINGMTWAFGALYAGVNDYEKKSPSGLYRITDTNGDDQLDRVELLRDIKSGGDHGVHAVVPTPDGKALYLVCGNNAELTQVENTSPVPKLWGDDHLLPRMPDGRGHNRHVLAPGGIIYRVTPDGQKFEVFASGFRNIYGAAVNRDGELFTYDADMEYDFNTPWYRPTRVNHVVSGGEYGWRNGAGKYPEFYPDNLPATLNIGPGSPTGTTFGYGAKFPAKYQNAYFILDWSWGKIYAVHLKAQGATYKATKEEFVTGAPLPVTDALIHPKDGAMYFAIGGRRVQSGLYRVRYTGKENTAPAIQAPQTTPERDLRLSLEKFHGRQDPAAVEAAWPHLNHADRWIRNAARVALEHQPHAQWADRALEEKDPSRQLEALLALVRQGAACPSHRPADTQPDGALRDRILGALVKLPFQQLTKEQKIAHVRIAEIALHRFGNPDAAGQEALVKLYDPAFPDASFELNWVLIETLSHLQAPNAAAKGMALVAAAPSQEPEMEYMRSLRMLKTGWTPELRAAQLQWFLKAANYKGGSSFTKFIEFIRNDSLATFSTEENTAHAELIAKKPEIKSPLENLGALFAGRTPKNWTLEELSAATANGLKSRSFLNGQKMFGAAACFACHRFGNAGGMNGPDLTGAGGRYSPHDLLDQIIHPSKEINEQFAPIVVTKQNGETLTGVIVNLSGDTVMINTDLTNPDQRVGIDRKTVQSIELSKVSPMPPMLLSMLNQEEILDLVAFILSGGDPANPMFAK
jgi:putative heme-binding domain-containing protein